MRPRHPAHPDGWPQGADGGHHPQRATVLVGGAGGTRDRRPWGARGDPGWTVAGPIRSVRIDPDASLPIEGPRANNARAVHPPALLPFSARTSTWIALALRWLGP